MLIWRKPSSLMIQGSALFSLSLIAVACGGEARVGRAVVALDSGSSVIQASQKLGVVSIGLTGIKNKAESAITIQKVEIPSPPKDLEVLGVRLYRPSEHSRKAVIAYFCGFPPKNVRTLRPSGFILGPGEEVFLAIGVDVRKRTGKKLYLGKVVIAYRVGGGKFAQAFEVPHGIQARPDAPEGKPCDPSREVSS